MFVLDFDPDADLGNGSSSQATGATGGTLATPGVTGGTPEPNGSVSANGAAPTVPDLSQLSSQRFSDGLNEATNRARTAASALGVTVPDNASLSDILTLVAKGSKPTTATKDEPKPSEKEQELAARLEALEKANKEVTERAQSAERERSLSLIRANVQAAFKDLPLPEVEGATDDAVDLFLLRYRVEQLTGGEIRVYKGQNLVFTPEGKIASVQEAAQMFYQSRGYFQRSSYKASTGPRGEAIAAGVRIVSKEDFAKGPGNGFTNEDVIKGRVRVAE